MGPSFRRDFDVLAVIGLDSLHGVPVAAGNADVVLTFFLCEGSIGTVRYRGTGT